MEFNCQEEGPSFRKMDSAFPFFYLFFMSSFEFFSLKKNTIKMEVGKRKQSY